MMNATYFLEFAQTEYVSTLQRTLSVNAEQALLLMKPRKTAQVRFSNIGFNE